MSAASPTTVDGGPEVVTFEPPPNPVRKPRPRPKLEPRQQEAQQDLLSAKDFVIKYRREAITASWDPKVLRKCGRGAERILMTLGAHEHKEKVPMHELARRKQLLADQAALEGIHKRDQPPKKKKKPGK
jgi:leucyl aminopeptidase (aminopeptidase T)